MIVTTVISSAIVNPRCERGANMTLFDPRSSARDRSDHDLALPVLQLRRVEDERGVAGENALQAQDHHFSTAAERKRLAVGGDDPHHPAVAVDRDDRGS